jgi:predicted Zn-dependent peptidase
MTQHRFPLIPTVVLVAVATVAPAFAQRHPSELPKPVDVKFTPPKPVELTLANGIHVFYLQDRELPTVTVTGMLKAGSLYDPADKVGLASLTGTVLRTGGTKTMTGDDMNEELEFLAASIESSMGSEFGYVTARCMKKDFARVMQMYADAVMNPEFRQDKIDLARNQALESIRRRWDMPVSAAAALFQENVYGDHPLGRRMTPKSLGAITRDDLVAFHKSYFAPNNFWIGITGDLAQAEAISAVEAAFKAWAKKTVTLPAVTPLVEHADGTVYYAYKDTPQANVFLGHLGIRRLNPDEYKIELMNYILGGGTFSARLMRELRSNRGLTYGIYGGVESGPDRGLFLISSQLKAERFVEALDLVKGIIKDMQGNLVSEAEMAEAKNSTINSFIFRYETKAAVMSQVMSLKLEGYPDNYLDTYIDNIRKVTREDVLAVAKKYLDPEKMMVLVVGDEKRFDKPLSTYGKVKTIDLKSIIDAERAATKPSNDRPH